MYAYSKRRECRLQNGSTVAGKPPLTLRALQRPAAGRQLPPRPATAWGPAWVEAPECCCARCALACCLHRERGTLVRVSAVHIRYFSCNIVHVHELKHHSWHACFYSLRGLSTPVAILAPATLAATSAGFDDECTNGGTPELACQGTTTP